MKEKISKSEFVRKHGYFVPTLHEKYVKGVEISAREKNSKKLQD